MRVELILGQALEQFKGGFKMQQTTNLGLKKPDYADVVDIVDINLNMDVIDETIGNKAGLITAVKTSIVAAINSLLTLASTTVNGLMSKLDKAKLDGIESGANKYIHPGTGTNPHGTTKSDVGLGSVINYGIATQAEAVAGTSDTKYMTPLKTAQHGANYARTDTVPVFAGGKQSTVQGGGISIAKAPSDVLLAGDVRIDIFGDTIRFWEAGGLSRGAYIHLALCEGDVSTPVAINKKIGLALQNGWITTGEYDSPKAYLCGRLVFLSLDIKNGSTTAGSAICTLPAEYRPLMQQLLLCSNALTTVGLISIGSDGIVRVAIVGYNSRLTINAVYGLG